MLKMKFYLKKFNKIQNWKNININLNWMTKINFIIKTIRQIFEFFTWNFERVSIFLIRFTKRTIIVFIKKCSISFVSKNDNLIWKKYKTFRSTLFWMSIDNQIQKRQTKRYAFQWNLIWSQSILRKIKFEFHRFVVCNN